MFSKEPNLKQIYLWVFAAFIISLIVYFPLTAISPQDSDGAEYAAAAVTGSIVHPPGYPVYVSITRFLITFFSENPYQTLSTFSAVTQSLAVGILVLVLLELGVAPILALLVALCWGFYGPSVKVASDVEVFALHHLFVCLSVLFSLKLLRNIHSSNSESFFFTLLIGLAAAHHQTIVLWMPLFVFSFFSALRKLPKVSQVKFFYFGFFGFLLGFSAYLLLFIIHKNAPILAFTEPKNFNDLYHYIMRTAYGTLSLTVPIETESQSYLGNFLRSSLLAMPVILISALFSFYSLKEYSAKNWGICLSLCANLAFGYLLILPPNEEMYVEWVSRFYPLIALSLAITSGIVFAKIQKSRLIEIAVALGLFLPTVLALKQSMAYANARGDLTTKYEVQQTFKELPQNSLYIAATDRISLSMVYYTKALKMRPDLTVVVLGVLGGKEYLAQLKKDHPAFETFEPGPKFLRRFVDLAREKGMHVFSNHGTEPPEGYRAVPIGVSWQWIKSEDLPARIEVTKKLLAFCANWPLEIQGLPKERTSSRYTIGKLFLWPISTHVPLVEDPVVANALTEAAKSFIEGDIQAARESCKQAYTHLTGNSDPKITAFVN